MCVVWLDLKCEGDIKSGDSYLVMVMEAMEFNKLSQLLLMMDPIMLEL